MYGKNNIEQTMMIFFLRAMIYYDKTDKEIQPKAHDFSRWDEGLLDT